MKENFKKYNNAQRLQKLAEKNKRCLEWIVRGKLCAEAYQQCGNSS